MLVRNNDDKSTPCVVRKSAINCARRAGLIDCLGDAEECRVIESVRKLMALGLSAEEIEDLDIRQPMLQAICEYSRLDEGAPDAGDHATDVADTTLKLIDDQIRGLDLELEMLTLRKCALGKRTRVLKKLAQSLSSRGSSGLAA